ncbi:TRANSLATION INITIATION FACTOR 2 ALPHA SUBUNIT [Encephalitozoon cuniculi GB-M1]|uniref:TRANSLATION INITIATION FACTOR 2 ALPHA SUBUNIT n=2 Tax=Encephalitozoon cuniculi TaxID=6035 RepID=Q8SQW4_ENCCU|nr:translation initiation factor eIF2 subunit alpha [Encephalitozoon cuniculi GB-M1]AGE94934.1 translation initiation factor 2 alpha subunit [Encephalitozoon cuniculi]KMV65051.1 translation initiation factor 2 subunit alpha [Encephalitozoon cuniculi EcunIII-L]UYI26296.1 translation initiation factor 2 subunit 1 [Encephalitozoon cuniculi]CAD26003.1 TRANSLATION INITIATION FACTOR 2 ALPHA SUBUNIT [Encephalitozoon cuniculi GB-M1]
MLRYECRLHSRKYPREGEIVIGRVVSIGGEGLTLNLLEYGDLEGLVLLGELSKRRVRSIQQVTKVGNIEICNVLKVDEGRGYIDLSMSKVTENEKSECRETSAKNKLAYHIMVKAAKRLGMEVSELYERMGYDKEEEFGSLYYFFARVKDNGDIMDDDAIGVTIKKLIREQFQASTYKVRADIDVVCSSRGGIVSIKKVFSDALRLDPRLEFCLIKTPTYSVTRVSSNKDKAYEVVREACNVLISNIQKEGGTATVISQPKLYGEKSRYNLLNFEENEESSSE